MRVFFIVIINLVLLKTAAMETALWLSFSTAIFRWLYGTCRFHLCLSCFDTVMEIAVGSRPTKVSNLSMKVQTRMRSLLDIPDKTQLPPLDDSMCFLLVTYK